MKTKINFKHQFAESLLQRDMKDKRFGKQYLTNIKAFHKTA